MRTYRFTVTGRGRFPFDMLRYDQCYPVNEGVGLGREDPERREVLLETQQKRKHWEPTVQRWRSFGWSVVPTIRGYQDEPVSYTTEVT